MAYGSYANTGSYPTNAVPGWAQGIDEASIYDIDSKPKFAVGTGFKRADGAIFRYVNSITGVAANKLVAHNDDMDVAYATSLITLGTAATQQGGDPIGIYPSLINSRYVLIAKASTTKDQFAGGYLNVCRGTGAPATYRIKGNTAAATVNSVSNTVIIELFEPLTASLAASTSTYLSIQGSMYNYVELALAGGTYCSSSRNAVVGVTQATLTANTWGWVQTHGVTACLADGTITTGCLVSTSAKIVGAVQQFGVGTTSNASNALFVNQAVGYAIDPGADTYYTVIYLTLE